MRRSGEAGFTLLELMIVLAIIAVVFTLITPQLGRIGKGGDIREKSAEIAALLRLARTEAIFRNDERVVSVDFRSRMIGSPTIKKATHIDDSIKLSVFTARDEIVSGDLASIRFLPNGSSTGGAITLESPRGSVQLRINWLTGAVTQDLRQGG